MTDKKIIPAEGNPDENSVREKYGRLTNLLIQRDITITTMESCTAGLVASYITDTEGASSILKGAFVTYSNEAKILHGVPEEIIRRYGIYSPETAASMASACRKTYRADIGIGITGSFGNPDPNNADSVPGEVFFALETKEKSLCYVCHVPFFPLRNECKRYVADAVADKLLSLLEKG